MMLENSGNLTEGPPMRFTLRQLAYFVAAGETGSVTQASERVSISQPSISAAIHHLEREFGLQLFIRHHAQGLSLTPAGVRFLQAAKDVLQSAHGLYDIASEATSTISGPINIGAFFTFAPLLIPELCNRFRADHPRVEMNVSEGSEASLLEKLRRARIDIALTYEQYITKDIAFEPLATLPTYVLVPAAHELAARESIRLEELESQPFVLLDLPLSREYFLSLFAQAGITPNITAHTPNAETLRAYVGSGFGISLMTARPLSKIAVNGTALEYVPLAGDYPPMILGMAWLKELRETRVMEAFKAHCRERISDESLPGMAPLMAR